MQARTKTVVAFFAGTGATFPAWRRGTVSEKDLGNKKKTINPADDDSFSLLSDLLADDQMYFGYNGCHLRKGGVFSFGIHQPGQHLYEKVKAMTAEFETIKVVLVAHSRGCLSALYFCRLVADDIMLAPRVEIALDLHDPVPGNFRTSTFLDKSHISTSAGQLRYFKDSTSIKSAHVTVLEIGGLPYCFNTMIPKFSPTTKLEVEFLPGEHNITQSDQLNAAIDYNHEKNYLNYSEEVYLISILKTLQTFAEHGVHLFADCNDAYRDVLLRILYQKADMQELVEKMKGDPFPERYRGELIEKLQIAQVKYYDKLLKIYQAEPDMMVTTRHLHFGGKCGVLADKMVCNVFNTRHAGLLDALGVTVEAKPYVGYIGKRPDIGFRDMLETRYDALIRVCLKYQSRGESLEILDGMLHILQSQHFAADSMMERVESFTQLFRKHELVVSEQFKDEIDKILNSIATLSSRRTPGSSQYIALILQCHVSSWIPAFAGMTQPTQYLSRLIFGNSN